MEILLYLNGRVCRNLSKLQEVLMNGLYMDGVFFLICWIRANQETWKYG